MRTFPLVLLTALPLLSLVITGEAVAQYTPYYPTQPRVSPYINLLRSDVPAGVTYYGIIRPELEFRRSIQQLQGQSIAQQAALQQQTIPGQLTTGHDFGFLTHNSYFLNVGGPGSSAFGVNARPVAQPTPPTPTTPARKTR